MRCGLNAEPMFQRVPTGVGVYTLALCRGLAEIGRAGDVVLFHASHDQVPAEVAGLPMQRRAFGLERDGLYRSWREVRRPLPQLVCGPLDVVHAPGTAVPPTGAARLVATVHDLAPMRFPDRYPREARVILKRGALVAAREADLIITPSRSTALEVETLLDVEPDRIRVVPHGVGGPGHEAGIDAAEALRMVEDRGIRPPYLLWIGTQEQRKNVQAVLDAFAMVSQDHGDVSLVLHGPNGWLGAEVAEGIERRGLEKRTVVSEGSLSRREVNSLYSAAEAFVFPSLYEGFGLPVLEAMACGTPVITSNCSALPESAGDAAILVDPHDHDALAAAIRRLLDDEGLREELRVLGRERASRFTWAATARRTWSVYAELAG